MLRNAKIYRVCNRITINWFIMIFTILLLGLVSECGFMLEKLLNVNFMKALLLNIARSVVQLMKK